MRPDISLCLTEQEHNGKEAETLWQMLQIARWYEILPPDPTRAKWQFHGAELWESYAPELHQPDLKNEKVKT